jgi:hypothetical protein
VTGRWLDKRWIIRRQKREVVTGSSRGPQVAAHRGFRFPFIEFPHPDLLMPVAV